MLESDWQCDSLYFVIVSSEKVIDMSSQQCNEVKKFILLEQLDYSLSISVRDS